jgi:hypothetical protein
VILALVLLQRYLQKYGIIRTKIRRDLDFGALCNPVVQSYLFFKKAHVEIIERKGYDIEQGFVLSNPTYGVQLSVAIFSQYVP